MTGASLLLLTVNFSLGLAAGAIMYRADFCVAGMFRDLFLFRKTIMLRSLFLLVAASMLFFESLRQGGFLTLYPFPQTASPSLTNTAGGIIFGIGMILAGGCVVGTLYKTGGGSILSATAFLGMIVGSGIYAEIHPWWESVIRRLTFLKGHILLPQAIGCDPSLLLLPILVLAGLLFYRWHREQKWEVASPAAGHLQPWCAALLLALLGSLSYLFVGMPFGITTSYAKAAAYFTGIVAPDHVAQNLFYSSVPLNYGAPFTGVKLHGGPGPFLDAIAAIQFPLIAGIILGALVTAIYLKEFKIYFRVPPRQYVSALLGGILLALGSRMAQGCNVWHLFGGLPVLNMQSLLFLAGILPGAYIGSKILVAAVLSISTKGSP